MNGGEGARHGTAWHGGEWAARGVHSHGLGARV